MKPAPFEYHRAYLSEEVVALLTELGDEAKVLAGGQSLAPMLNFRLARPSALVDINRVKGLDYIRRDGDALCVGALTRHRTLETSRAPEVRDGFDLLPRAARWIGHYPIRSRGTVGGSIAHSDPTAEWCLLARLFDADIVVLGQRGTRRVASADWFTGFLTTAAEPNEFVVETRFNRPRPYGALTEYARRRGDFAIAAAAVAFDVVDGRCSDVGIVLGGVATEPLRVAEAEAIVDGAEPSESVWAEAARCAAAAIRPTSDVHGDEHYRRHLVETLTTRALAEAYARSAS
ncbi:FAD binding domain-containing protein [Solicola gregarius]|uniref:FAD binding domain-containing protein n=1 Tax=Solicola gregarius TaxID=2908642 RepID=A0AA46TL22_9ACTN|nr:FAD binding domain-containing protein [Solicola gregarius]UYM07284.1 FAD binding domain-containing protein [Solicola gregarius]